MVNEDKSISYVSPEQFFIENVIRSSTFYKFMLTISSVVEGNVDPSSLIPFMLGKCVNILSPLYIVFYKLVPTVVQLLFELY